MEYPVWSPVSCMVTSARATPWNEINPARKRNATASLFREFRIIITFRTAHGYTTKPGEHSWGHSVSENDSPCFQELNTLARQCPLPPRWDICYECVRVLSEIMGLVEFFSRISTR